MIVEFHQHALYFSLVIQYVIYMFVYSISSLRLCVLHSFVRSLQLILDIIFILLLWLLLVIIKPTLKVQIFASSNFGENKFLRELIFAILVKFAKFAKISSRLISKKRQIREIFLKKRERRLQISSSSFPDIQNVF